MTSPHADPTTPEPPEAGPLLPFLPMVYVAWADGVLTRDEMERIRAKLREETELPPEVLERLEGWLSPWSPPSASELAWMKESIRTAAARLPPVERGSLAELGARLAGSSPRDVAALEAIEELVGVPGAEATRELLAPPPTPPSSDRAPAPEGAGAPFDPEGLRRYLDHDHLRIRDQVIALLGEPEFRIADHLPKEEHRERVLQALRRLASEGLGAVAYPEAFGGDDDPAGAITVFETLGLGDLSVMIKCGVQFGLWGGSIHQLGTEQHHRRWLKAAGTLELPGCYAMTELSHGSNVRDIETTATWIPEADAFEIDTPHPLAGKEWIGNAARHGRMATVFAQLRVGAEEHGVHAFVVPIRDEHGRPLPRIRIEDCGWKVGLNGIDNGRIWFDRVRIPRDHLLDRFGTVTEAGRYESPIPGAGKRFFTMLGTLVTGRISIAAGALMATRVGLTVAVRFSDRRRQFGPAGGSEVPILDYLAQQRLLLPGLARTYALTFAVRGLVRDYAALRADDGGEGARELEGLAAGLKAVATRHAMELLQACREACGGQGYRSDNRIGRLRADVDIFTTFEGTNVVLLQLLAKGLLSRFREEMGDLRLRGVFRLLAERAGTRLTELNPVVTRRTDEEHLRDPDLHRAALRYREDRLLRSVAGRLRRLLDEGMDSFDAMNRVQDHLVELATAHVERVALERFLQAVEDAPEPAIADALRPLATLYGLDRIEAHRGWYLEAGYLESPKSRAIRRLVNTVCGEVREVAVPLVDAFGIPDDLLGAPAALRPTGV